MKTRESKTGSWKSRAAKTTLAVLATMAVSGADRKCQARNQIAEDVNPQPHITVLVYVYARISPYELATAERVASKVIQETGLELTWIDCPRTPSSTPNPACKIPPAPTNLYLNIMPGLDLGPGVPESALGLAATPTGPGRGYLAIASYSRVRSRLKKPSEMALGQLLGKVIAHEIGHLLLGSNDHSPNGLMSAYWSAEQLRYPAIMQLNFSKDEATRIRADVRARMRDQDSQDTVTLASR